MECYENKIKLNDKETDILIIGHGIWIQTPHYRYNISKQSEIIV